MVPAAENFRYDIPRTGFNVRPMLDALADRPRPESLLLPPGHPDRPNPIAVAEAFESTMRDVGPTLPSAQLQDSFHYVYWLLSRACLDSIYQNNNSKAFTYPTFEMPEKVAAMMVGFGEKYLGQLEHFGHWIEGDDQALNKMTMPWLLALLHPALRPYAHAQLQASRGDNMDGMKFLAGMISHIVADLGLSIEEGGLDDGYRRDFSGPVQTLIRHITERLAHALMPGTRTVREKMIGPTVGYIGMIREVAWEDAVLLDGAATKDRAEPVAFGPSRKELIVGELHDRAARDIELLLRVGRLPHVIGRQVLARNAEYLPPHYRRYDLAAG